ncbi:replication initiator protein A, partial [Clostridium perfringens]
MSRAMDDILLKQGDLFQLASPLYGDVQGERTVAEFPFFALSKKAHMTPMVFENGDARIEINPSKTGVATIYDKEILLYIASLMAE